MSVCMKLRRKGSIFVFDSSHPEKVHRMVPTVSVQGAWTSVRTGTVIDRKQA